MYSRSQIRRYQEQARERAEQLGGVSFRDLPAADYPFTMIAEDSSTGAVLWSVLVTGPGAIEVPPLSHLCSPGAMVRSRITYASGRVEVWPPDVAENSRC